MNLARKLKKFGITSALVLAPFLLNGQSSETPKQIPPLSQLVQSHDLKENYKEIYAKEVIKNNLNGNLEYGTGISLITPQDSYLRNHFPIQYGGELNINFKIPNSNFKATSFVNIYKGDCSSNSEKQIKGSTFGFGVEYPLILDWGVGIVNKTQEISGPPNGFPDHLNKTGFYLSAKKEIPIIPEALLLFIQAKCNLIKQIGSNELSLGLVLKPQQSPHSR